MFKVKAEIYGLVLVALGLSLFLSTGGNPGHIIDPPGDGLTTIWIGLGIFFGKILFK